MSQFSKSVSKNKLRTKMIAEGKIKTIYFSRDDESTTVNEKIRAAFGIERFKILECKRVSQRLFLSPVKDFDGSQAIERRRALYLCEVSYQ